MNTTTYYIPTNSAILPIYFGSGLIMPSGHYQGLVNIFQNISEGAIILSENKWAQGANCSIEILLSPNEINTLARHDLGYYTLNTALPISRIKHVFFQDTEQMDNTTWNINSGAGFIPKRMASAETVKPENSEADASKVVKPQPLSEDLVKKARQFNILLGGFAFMKVAADQQTNFPHNYFATLSFFNAIIADQVKAVEIKEGLTFDYDYTGLFIDNSQWQYWKQFIYKDIKEANLESIAREKGIKLEKKVGQIQLDKLNVDDIFYDLVLLSTYGENKKKGLPDLFSLFEKAGLSDRKREEIAFLFGLHIGYAKLRNSYQVNKTLVETKFSLESELDYYIIESLYQYVFTNTVGKASTKDNFDYITSIVPQYKKHLSKTDHSVIKYWILNTEVATKKKEADSKDSFDLQSELFKEIAIDISSWFGPNPIFKADRASIQQYLQTKFGPLLAKIVSEYVAQISSTQQTMEAAKTTSNMPEVIAKEDDAKLEVNTDHLEGLTFVELKAMAKSNKIKINSKMKGSSKDMEELKRILRNTPTIL